MNRSNGFYNSIRNVYYFIKNLPQNTKREIDTHSIKQFKDKHKGETCFVIGNGPSMTIEDLNKIYELGVKSFACNKIFKIFKDTKWRPDYYFLSDDKIVDDIDLCDIGVSSKLLFYPRKYKKKLKIGNTFEELQYRWLEEGKFSIDAHKGVYQCGTVIALAIQFAYYMGFQKVYIIGVDFSYNMLSVDEKNKTFKNGDNNYFIKDYASKGQVLNLSDKRANILGFQAAREGFESNGREIYNATRGGKLEVFKRKNLDEVFKEIEDCKK